jgi:hypothetical protein
MNMKINLKSIFANIYVVVICLLIICRCGHAQNANRHNKDFESFKSKFLETWWSVYPVESVYAGYQKYDSLPVVYNDEFFDNRRVTLNDLLNDTREWNRRDLSPGEKVDLKIINDRIEGALWYLDEFKEYEWNPAVYNLGGEFAEIIFSTRLPLDRRLKVINSRLRDSHLYFAAAQKNLKSVVPEHLNLAILQNEGSLEVFQKVIPDSMALSKLSPADKKHLQERLDNTIESIGSYLSFLRTLADSREESGFRGFRIGREMYEAKFKHDVNSSFQAQEVYDRALERKREVVEKMAEISRKLWGKYYPGTTAPEDMECIKGVLAKISEVHDSNNDMVSIIREQIPKLEEFIRMKKLVELDPSRPLVVRETPMHMRGGGAGASISAPGPYNPTGNTYYNVDPITDLPRETQESLMREYNPYTLQILNIHEAIPGHYTQLMYSNKTPNLVRSVLENGAMIEGWAVYAERMMLEQGYGDDSPELWLMYYKWHLRSVCNTILDYSVHVLGWNEKVAMQFLTREAFQEQAEAEGKWRRVKLTQVQLCTYFTGYTEIYEFREELKNAQGDQFNLRKFHDQFLSYGSIPVRYIRELMMK